MAATMGVANVRAFTVPHNDMAKLSDLGGAAVLDDAGRPCAVLSEPFVQSLMDSAPSAVSALVAHELAHHLHRDLHWHMLVRSLKGRSSLLGWAFAATVFTLGGFAAMITTVWPGLTGFGNEVAVGMFAVFAVIVVALLPLRADTLMACVSQAQELRADWEAARAAGLDAIRALLGVIAVLDQEHPEAWPERRKSVTHPNGVYRLAQFRRAIPRRPRGKCRHYWVIVWWRWTRRGYFGL